MSKIVSKKVENGQCSRQGAPLGLPAIAAMLTVCSFGEEAFHMIWYIQDFIHDLESLWGIYTVLARMLAATLTSLLIAGTALVVSANKVGVGVPLLVLQMLLRTVLHSSWDSQQQVRDLSLLGCLLLLLVQREETEGQRPHMSKRMQNALLLLSRFFLAGVYLLLLHKNYLSLLKLLIYASMACFVLGYRFRLVCLLTAGCLPLHEIYDHIFLWSQLNWINIHLAHFCCMVSWLGGFMLFIYLGPGRWSLDGFFNGMETEVKPFVNGERRKKKSDTEII